MWLGDRGVSSVEKSDTYGPPTACGSFVQGQIPSASAALGCCPVGGWHDGSSSTVPRGPSGFFSKSTPLLRVLSLFSWVVHPHFQQADPVLVVPQAFPLQSVGLDMKFENRALKTPKLEPEMEGQQRPRGRAFGRGDEQGRVVRG